LKVPAIGNRIAEILPIDSDQGLSDDLTTQSAGIALLRMTAFLLRISETRY